MKKFPVSLIFLGLSALSIVNAQPFGPGGYGPGGSMGPHGPGRGSNSGNQPMTEAEFMGMAAPPQGKRLALTAADKLRYEEYVKNFNSGQGANSPGQGGSNFGPGGPGGPGGFGTGPGGMGPHGPRRPPFGPGPGGPPFGPGGPGGRFGPGGPHFGPGPFGGPNGQNSGGSDYNSADTYSSGDDNAEAVAMVNEVISDGNYSPQEKEALKSSAAEIAREFVQEEETRAGYNTYSGAQQFSLNSQANWKMAPFLGNTVLLLILTYIFHILN